MFGSNSIKFLPRTLYLQHGVTFSNALKGFIAEVYDCNNIILHELHVQALVPAVKPRQLGAVELSEMDSNLDLHAFGTDRVTCSNSEVIMGERQSAYLWDI